MQIKVNKNVCLARIIVLLAIKILMENLNALLVMSKISTPKNLICVG
jgi:hypothetical protein